MPVELSLFDFLLPLTLLATACLLAWTYADFQSKRKAVKDSLQHWESALEHRNRMLGHYLEAAMVYAHPSKESVQELYSAKEVLESAQVVPTQRKADERLTEALARVCEEARKTGVVGDPRWRSICLQIDSRQAEVLETRSQFLTSMQHFEAHRNGLPGQLWSRLTSWQKERMDFSKPGQENK